MGFPWKRFAEIVKAIAPMTLIAVNPALAPIASVITHAIADAQQTTNADGTPLTGVQKSAYVQKIVADVVPVIPGVDADAINGSLQLGIDTVIAATKIHKSTPTA